MIANRIKQIPKEILETLRLIVMKKKMKIIIKLKINDFNILLHLKSFKDKKRTS